MKIQSLFPLVALAFVAGCHGDGSGYVPVPPPKVDPANVKPGEETTLMPIAVGNQWTYEFETLVRDNRAQQKTKGEITFKVVNVEQTADGKKADLEVWAKDKLQDKQVWLVGPKGVYKVSSGIKTVTTFIPPSPIILFPLDKYKTFTWQGTGGKVNRTASSTIRVGEEIDTDEKRYSAVAVETKGINSNGKIVQRTDETNWLVPGVGLVRNRISTVSPTSASEMLIKLKSHTLK